MGDKHYCPDIDGLSRSALVFGSVFDHPAHEGYRHWLLPHIFPHLGPATLRPWLRRREKAWETGQKLMDEESERRREREGAHDVHDPDGTA